MNSLVHTCYRVEKWTPAIYPRNNYQVIGTSKGNINLGSNDKFWSLKSCLVKFSGYKRNIYWSPPCSQWKQREARAWRRRSRATRKVSTDVGVHLYSRIGDTTYLYRLYFVVNLMKWLSQTPSSLDIAAFVVAMLRHIYRRPGILDRVAPQHLKLLTS